MKLVDIKFSFTLFILFHFYFMLTAVEVAPDSAPPSNTNGNEPPSEKVEGNVD